MQFLSLTIFLPFLVAFSGSGALPKGKIAPPKEHRMSASTGKTEGVTKSLPIAGCGAQFASPLGGRGNFYDGAKIYRQIFIKSVDSNKSRQVFQEVDVEKNTYVDLLSLTIPRVDTYSYDVQDGKEGVSFLSYKSNSDLCFLGDAKVTSLPILRDTQSQKIELLSEQGVIVSALDAATGWRFFDKGLNRILHYRYYPFLKRHSQFNFEEGHRVLYFGGGFPKRPYVTWKPANEAKKLPAMIVKFDQNSLKIAEFPVAENEKVIFNAEGEFGKIALEKDSPNFELTEVKDLNSGLVDKVYKGKLPAGFFGSQASMLVNFKKKLLVLSGLGDFFRLRWKTILVFDYEKGVEVFRVVLQNGVSGQVSMDSDSRKLIVEEVNPTTGVRLALHLLDMNTGKKTVLNFKMGTGK